MKTKNLTWVLAHEPFELFYKAADQFCKEVAAETNGEINITVCDLPEYNKSAGLTLTTKGRDDRKAIIDLVNSGRVDMATVYVNSLALINPDLYVWDMPYLIRDEEQAYRALDGEIGKALLAGVAQRSQVKPLVYTFSGGFRLMPSVTAYETFKDFENTRVGISMSPVAHDTFTAVNARPKQVNVEDVRDAIAANEIDSGETTYPRFFVLGHDKVSKFINHTEHCLFLTGLVINQPFWNTLTSKQQQIFQAAADHAAEVERAETLSTVKPVQEQAAKLGIQTITMSAHERQKFMEATDTMYSKYETWFSPGVLSGLRNTH